MKDFEIIKSLEKIYSVSTDTHSIYTPLDLCDEMISSITKLSGVILVISNLEFLIVLKRKNVDMNTVHYTTSCDIKKQVAIQLGVNLNNIHNLEYNKEINIGIEENMKFDVIVMNSPYNPNSLWKKFTLKAIDTLKDDGQMVSIHPSGWRESSTHKKLCEHLKEHISELHICDYENFKDDNVRIKTDWYLYNKLGEKNTNCFYPNGDNEIVDLTSLNMIFRISPSSIPSKIISKIFTKKDNGMIAEKGFNELYDEKVYVETGLYRQCGGKGRGRGNGWTTGKFVYTNKPSKNQFENKVVAAYTHKPRAQFFSTEEQTGVILGNYWITDNKSLPILLNSKLFWKLYTSIISPDKGQYGSHEIPANIPAWFYKSLNFDNLNVQNEEELYTHYGLSDDEISWIESEN